MKKGENSHFKRLIFFSLFFGIFALERLNFFHVW